MPVFATRVQMTRSANKYTCRVWQGAYFAAAKSMPHKQAVAFADAVWAAR